MSYFYPTMSTLTRAQVHARIGKPTSTTATRLLITEAGLFRECSGRLFRVGDQAVHEERTADVGGVEGHLVDAVAPEEVWLSPPPIAVLERTEDVWCKDGITLTTFRDGDDGDCPVGAELSWDARAGAPPAAACSLMALLYSPSQG